MTGALYRVGRACAKHHWPVIAVWVVATWIPKWLDKILPRVNIEGGDFFEKQAAADLAKDEPVSA